MAEGFSLENGQQDGEMTRSRSNTWPSLKPEPAKVEEPTVVSGAGRGAPNGGSATHRKAARRNAWGSMSYAELITRAIQSSPEKRKTLNQIYEWMVENVAYFKDKGDTNSSAGWKNSIRHNLSLHQRFVRVPNEQTGKSSWWMINPDAKPGKPRRQRAHSLDSGTPSPIKAQVEKKRARRVKQVKAMSESPVRSPSSALSSSSFGSPGPGQGPGSPSSPLQSESFGSASSAPCYLSPLNDSTSSPLLFPEASPFYDELAQTVSGSEGSSFDDAGSFLSAEQMSDFTGKMEELDSTFAAACVMTEDQIETAIASLDINMAASGAPSTYRAPFQPTLSPVSGTPFDTPRTGVTPHGTPPPARHHSSSGSNQYLDPPQYNYHGQSHLAPGLAPWQQASQPHMQHHYQQQFLQQQQQLHLQQQQMHIQQQHHLQHQQQQQHMLHQHAMQAAALQSGGYQPPTYHSPHNIIPSSAKHSASYGQHSAGFPTISHPLADNSSDQDMASALHHGPMRICTDFDDSAFLNGASHPDIDMLQRAIETEENLVFHFDHFADEPALAAASTSGLAWSGR